MDIDPRYMAKIGWDKNTEKIYHFYRINILHPIFLFGLGDALSLSVFRVSV